MEEEKLIYSPALFVLYSKFLRFNKHIQAGRYEFNTGMSMAEIVRYMEKGGRANEIVVTIPEGFTLEQIANLLNMRTVVPADNFYQEVRQKKYIEQMNIPRENVEGYLFPDTYQMVYQMSPERTVEMMLNRFEEVAIPVYSKYANFQTGNYAKKGREKGKKDEGLTLDEAVILASIIEKEAGERSEMRLISSVFHNRLKRGMPLQSEATVRYAVKRYGQPVTIEDLKSNSPYNTYRRMGLPIGPICNPGASAIEAALNPESSKYLYFVSKNDNTHEFSMTLDEHNAAVAKYKNLVTLTNQSLENLSEESTVVELNKSIKNQAGRKMN